MAKNNSPFNHSQFKLIREKFSFFSNQPRAIGWLFSAIFWGFLAIVFIIITLPDWNRNNDKSNASVHADICSTSCPSDCPLFVEIETQPTLSSSETEETSPNTEDSGTTESSEPSNTESENRGSTETTPEENAIDLQIRENARLELTNNIESLLNEKLGRYGIYYLNMENGESIALFAEEPFVAASSIKLAYNTYLYQQIIAGQFSMHDKMTYNSTAYPEGDYESGSGVIKNKPNGAEFTLEEISHLSIYNSDNCATNMILRQLGGIENVNTNYLLPTSGTINYRESTKYTDFSGKDQSGRNRTSAKDLALYAKNLYDLYQENNDGYLPLINELSDSIYTWGISTIQTPEGESVSVSNKIGTNTKYFTHNDSGIIFGPENYVLAIMTENSNYAGAKEMIGQVSQMIYDYILVQAK